MTDSVRSTPLEDLELPSSGILEFTLSKIGTATVKINGKEYPPIKIGATQAFIFLAILLMRHADGRNYCQQQSIRLNKYGNTIIGVDNLTLCYKQSQNDAGKSNFTLGNLFLQQDSLTSPKQDLRRAFDDQGFPWSKFFDGDATGKKGLFPGIKEKGLSVKLTGYAGGATNED